MTQRSTLIAAVSGSLAAVTLAGSALAVVAVAAPGTGVAAASGLSSVHEARANRALEGAPTADALRVAEQETRRSLSLSVANPTAWLRLAYVERRQADAFSPAAGLAVQHSYDLAPYGPDDTPWRLAFLFGDWRFVGADLRQIALAETRVTRTHNRSALHDLPDRIGDPSGRLAAKLAVGRYDPAP